MPGGAQSSMPRPNLQLVPSDSDAPSSGREEVSLDPGHPDFLAACFRRYAPYVARIGYRLLGERAEVEDLVQDVFVDAQRGLGQLRDPRAVKAWLSMVAVRRARRRLRARKLARFFGASGGTYEELEAPGASMEQKHLLADAYRALDAVSVDARIAWILRHVEGEDLRTIATACDCSLATVKRRIAAAQLRLDEVLGHE